ncbi:hypothetical protein ElyMa_003906800 [Elysia marginata]|uniref:G-protein coupled receptors family 1 profile domain-containing protein n=1 Tax=Elysia marginata TaxID=1093978 RepID=A0AAV4FPU8_9GAST|nr:hypothetical protein ElyMa_003906800 [Elysia marginata]
MSIVPEYAKNGSYVNINQTFWSLGYMAETVNASINIVMYYSMSTRYRTTIHNMVCKRCFSAGAAGNTDDEDADPSTGKKNHQRLLHVHRLTKTKTNNPQLIPL